MDSVNRERMKNIESKLRQPLKELLQAEGYMYVSRQDINRKDLVEQLGSGIPRILQVYDKDVFKFSENFLRIVLPASASSTPQDTEQDTEQVTEQVLTLLMVMDNEKHSRIELMESVGIKHRPTFIYNYLQPAIEAGLVALTIPNKPTSGNQKYYLTEKGKAFNQP